MISDLTCMTILCVAAFANAQNKRVQRDHFDYLMEKRDDRIRDAGETLKADEAQ